MQDIDEHSFPRQQTLSLQLFMIPTLPDPTSPFPRTAETNITKSSFREKGTRLLHSTSPCAPLGSLAQKFAPRVEWNCFARVGPSLVTPMWQQQKPTCWASSLHRRNPLRAAQSRGHAFEKQRGFPELSTKKTPHLTQQSSKMRASGDPGHVIFFLGFFFFSR